MKIAGSESNKQPLYLEGTEFSNFELNRSWGIEPSFERENTHIGEKSDKNMKTYTLST